MGEPRRRGERCENGHQFCHCLLAVVCSCLSSSFQFCHRPILVCCNHPSQRCAVLPTGIVGAMVIMLIEWPIFLALALYLDQVRQQHIKQRQAFLL